MSDLLDRACSYLSSPDVLTALIFWSGIGTALASIVNWSMS